MDWNLPVVFGGGGGGSVCLCMHMCVCVLSVCLWNVFTVRQKKNSPGTVGSKQNVQDYNS